jgi:hypothetical protein
VGVEDRSNRVVVNEVSVLALRVVCGREWEMWSHAKKWERVELWSKENLVAISSCVDDCMGRRSHVSAISTLVENLISSTVQVLASGMTELGADKGG